jgi:benzil reductase ((S)-benzoin forming)
MGDRLALVTGTTSGIGESVAQQLLDRGWRVFGVARRGAAIRHERYEHLTVDLGDTPSLVRVIEPRLDALFGVATLSRVGLVNNAANVGLLGPVADMDIGQLPVVLATNLVAPMWLMGQFLRRTPNATPLRIVNVSTAAAVRGFAGLGAYGSSKAALRMAGMVLEAETEEQRSRGEDRDIAILSFEPGTVDTPMQEAARSSSRDTLPSVDMFKRIATEERLVPPAVPAKDIVTFLESDGEPLFTHRRHGAPRDA